ncbi:Uncharacterised protein [Raoultella ornithinolytica]|nr:Uncharacterised protein [Raoultella ornithinolytica]
MARAGFNQHPGMGGSPGQLLGIDLFRCRQPEGIGMFTPGNNPALRQVAVQRIIQPLPALGGVKVVAAQVGFIVPLGEKMGHLILNIGGRVAVNQPPQRAGFINQVRVGHHKSQPQAGRQRLRQAADVNHPPATVAGFQCR